MHIGSEKIHLIQKMIYEDYGHFIAVRLVLKNVVVLITVEKLRKDAVKKEQRKQMKTTKLSPMGVGQREVFLSLITIT